MGVRIQLGSYINQIWWEGTFFATNKTSSTRLKTHSSNSQRTKVLKVVRREEQVEETLEAVTNTNIEYLLLSEGLLWHCIRAQIAIDYQNAMAFSNPFTQSQRNCEKVLVPNRRSRARTGLKSFVFFSDSFQVQRSDSQVDKMKCLYRHTVESKYYIKLRGQTCKCDYFGIQNNSKIAT